MSTPLRPLVERILNGRLTDVLIERRAEELSYEQIARYLATVHQIEVSGEQVRKWCHESGVQAIVDSRKPVAS